MAEIDLEAAAWEARQRALREQREQRDAEALEARRAAREAAAAARAEETVRLHEAAAIELAERRRAKWTRVEAAGLVLYDAYQIAPEAGAAVACSELECDGRMIRQTPERRQRGRGGRETGLARAACDACGWRGWI